MTPQQQYTNIQRRVLDVEDYIDILRRHMSWILAPVFAGLVISCVIAFFMKNTYVSKAVLRITPSQISEALVPATVNQLMSDRVAQMETQILSRTSLGEHTGQVLVDEGLKFVDECPRPEVVKSTD